MVVARYKFRLPLFLFLAYYCLDISHLFFCCKFELDLLNSRKRTTDIFAGER